MGSPGTTLPPKAAVALRQESARGGVPRGVPSAGAGRVAVEDGDRGGAASEQRHADPGRVADPRGRVRGGTAGDRDVDVLHAGGDVDGGEVDARAAGGEDDGPVDRDSV